MDSDQFKFRMDGVDREVNALSRQMEQEVKHLSKQIEREIGYFFKCVGMEFECVREMVAKSKKV